MQACASRLGPSAFSFGWNRGLYLYRGVLIYDVLLVSSWIRCVDMDSNSSVLAWMLKFRFRTCKEEVFACFVGLATKEAGAVISKVTLMQIGLEGPGSGGAPDSNRQFSRLKNVARSSSASHFRSSMFFWRTMEILVFMICSSWVSERMFRISISFAELKRWYALVISRIVEF